ncbi:hypothetical protein SprV_0902704100 [Sparganum proliferum]
MGLFGHICIHVSGINRNPDTSTTSNTPTTPSPALISPSCVPTIITTINYKPPILAVLEVTKVYSTEAEVIGEDGRPEVWVDDYNDISSTASQILKSKLCKTYFKYSSSCSCSSSSSPSFSCSSSSFCSSSSSSFASTSPLFIVIFVYGILFISFHSCVFRCCFFLFFLFLYSFLYFFFFSSSDLFFFFSLPFTPPTPLAFLAPHPRRRRRRRRRRLLTPSFLPFTNTTATSSIFHACSLLCTTQFLLLLRLGPNTAFREAVISCRVLAFRPGPLTARSELTVTFLWRIPIVATSPNDLTGQLIAGSQNPELIGGSMLNLSSLLAVGMLALNF